MLLAEGVQLLLESNPTNCGPVSFARVLERANGAGAPHISRGSVLGAGRAWPSIAAFQSEVEVAAAAVLADIGPVLAATQMAAAAVLDRANLRSQAGRLKAVQQLCRVAGETYFCELVASDTWRLWVGLWNRMGAASGEVADSALGAALRRAQSSSHQQLVQQLYAPLAEVLRFCGRPEFGSTPDALAQMATAIMAVADGLAIHHRLSPESLAPIDRPTGPRGRPEPWHPFAIALEALVMQYLMPT